MYRGYWNYSLEGIKSREEAWSRRDKINAPNLENDCNNVNYVRAQCYNTRFRQHSTSNSAHSHILAPNTLRNH